MKKLLFFLFAILLYSCGNVPNNNTGNPSHNRADDMDDSANKMLAYNYAADFVRDKKGSGVKFPGLMTKKDHITVLGGGKYKINSYFDNNQGRVKFSCIIEFMNNKDVKCKNLQFF